MNEVIIGVMAMFTLMAGITICVGLYLHKRGTWVYREDLHKQLVSWHILEQENALSSVTGDVSRSFTYIYSFALVSAGCCILLAMLAMPLLSLLMTGSLLHGMAALSGYLFLAISLSSFFMGVGIGAVIGIWRLHRATSHKVSYSDLQQRRLSDYRSALLRWIPIMLVGWMLLMTVLLVPYMGPTIQIPIVDGDNIILANNLWIWCVVPLIVLILLGFEALLTRVALLSRLLILPDPTFARRADDMVRSTVIGIVQGGELNALGFLCTAQYILLAYNLWVGHTLRLSRTSTLASLLFGSIILAVVVFGVGAMIPVLRGRLGGRVNGWPWRRVGVSR